MPQERDLRAERPSAELLKTVSPPAASVMREV